MTSSSSTLDIRTNGGPFSAFIDKSQSMGSKSSNSWASSPNSSLAPHQTSVNQVARAAIAQHQLNHPITTSLFSSPSIQHSFTILSESMPQSLDFSNNYFQSAMTEQSGFFTTLATPMNLEEPAGYLPKLSSNSHLPFSRYRIPIEIPPPSFNIPKPSNMDAKTDDLATSQLEDGVKSDKDETQTIVSERRSIRQRVARTPYSPPSSSSYSAKKRKRANKELENSDSQLQDQAESSKDDRQAIVSERRSKRQKFARTPYSPSSSSSPKKRIAEHKDRDSYSTSSSSSNEEEMELSVQNQNKQVLPQVPAMRSQPQTEGSPHRTTISELPQGTENGDKPLPQCFFTDEFIIRQPIKKPKTASQKRAADLIESQNNMIPLVHQWKLPGVRRKRSKNKKKSNPAD